MEPIELGDEFRDLVWKVITFVPTYTYMYIYIYISEGPPLCLFPRWGILMHIVVRLFFRWTVCKADQLEGSFTQQPPRRSHRICCFHWAMRCQNPWPLSNRSMSNLTSLCKEKFANTAARKSICSPFHRADAHFGRYERVRLLKPGLTNTKLC